MLLLALQVFLFGCCKAQATYAEPTTFEALLWAYAAYAKNDSINSWTCYWCNRTTRLYKVITYEGKEAHTQAFIGTTADKRIVISFRGTIPTDWTNWAYNLKFFPVEWPIGRKNKTMVHQGFLQAWQELDLKIRSKFLELHAQCPTCKLVVVGHSLGGAMATCNAVNYSLDYNLKDITQFTFGQPRVGDPEFSKLHAELIPISWRVVNKQDMIPHVPFDNGFHDFEHVVREVWYYSNTQYRVCNDAPGKEDPTCSRGIPFGLKLSICDHGRYLNTDKALADQKPKEAVKRVKRSVARKPRRPKLK